MLPSGKNIAGLGLGLKTILRRTQFLGQACMHMFLVQQAVCCVKRYVRYWRSRE